MFFKGKSENLRASFILKIELTILKNEVFLLNYTIKSVILMSRITHK